MELDVDNSGTLTIEEIEKGFKEINIGISEEELNQKWEGLDFQKMDKLIIQSF